MTTRAQVAALARSYNGYRNGAGYNCANQFSADLGRPTEAWCADFVTDIYKRSGLPLPSMSPYQRTGFAYVPDGFHAGQARGAIKPSWRAQPGDLVIFRWPGGTAGGDHVEMAEGWANGVLHTVGGNSGPSNVDGYRGRGGVHRHVWSAPVNVGHRYVIGVIDMRHFVNFGSTPIIKPPAPPSGCRFRLLMAKTPHMVGHDVLDVQQALNRRFGYHLLPDSDYGPKTRDAVIDFQRKHKLSADGAVGCGTRAALGMAH